MATEFVTILLRYILDLDTHDSNFDPSTLPTVESRRMAKDIAKHCVGDDIPQYIQELIVKSSTKERIVRAAINQDAKDHDAFEESAIYEDACLDKVDSVDAIRAKPARARKRGNTDNNNSNSNNNS
eukprot:887075_1